MTTFRQKPKIRSRVTKKKRSKCPRKQFQFSSCDLSALIKIKKHKSVDSFCIEPFWSNSNGGLTKAACKSFGQRLIDNHLWSPNTHKKPSRFPKWITTFSERSELLYSNKLSHSIPSWTSYQKSLQPHQIVLICKPSETEFSIMYGY